MTKAEKMDRDAKRAQEVFDQMTESQLDALFPVGRSASAGLFGWERVYDSLDLRRCVFRTAKAARADRRKNLFTSVSPEAFLIQVDRVLAGRLPEQV